MEHPGYSLAALDCNETLYAYFLHAYVPGMSRLLLTVQLVSVKSRGILGNMGDRRDTRPDERNSSSSSLLHPCGASGTSLSPRAARQEAITSFGR